MSNKTTAKRRSSAPAARVRADPQLSPAAAYQHYLPEAHALPVERVRTIRIDLMLAQNNLMLGLLAVTPELPRLRKELPALPLDDLAELPARLSAVRYANARISELQCGGESFESLHTRARELREPLLTFAEVLVRLNILPAGRVRDIRAGIGPYDAGQDCVDLADLFSEYGNALKNKSPFDTSYLAATRQAGRALTYFTTPLGGRSGGSPELITAVDLRNRLWTLFEEAHLLLRKVGTYLFDDRVNELVPLLGSRLRIAPPERPEPAPQPEANP